MSPSTLNCAKYPIFSSPVNKYREEILGADHVNDNALWIKQNRFVLESMGDEQEACPEGLGLSYVPWLIDCLSVYFPSEKLFYGLMACENEEVFNSRKDNGTNPNMQPGK